MGLTKAAAAHLLRLLAVVTTLAGSSHGEDDVCAGRLFYVFNESACFERLAKSVHAGSGFPLEWLVNKRLCAHRCRTQDAAAAAAVFVPTFGGAADAELERAGGGFATRAGDDPRVRACLAELDGALRRHPRWQRAGGADFFWVWARTWRCCAGLQDAMLRTALNATTVFALEPPFAHNGWSAEMEAAAAGSLLPWPAPSALSFSDQCFPVASPPRVVAVPYPVVATGESAAALAAAVVAAQRSKRTVLMAAQMGVHGRGAGVRAALMRQCLAQPPHVCSALQPDADAKPHVPARVRKLPRRKWSDALLLAAAFSLAPAGDTPARSMVWKALRAGAVPVLFQSCEQGGFWDGAYARYLPPVARFGPAGWAVLLNSTEAMRNDTYVRDELRALPPDAVQLLRDVGRRLLPRNLYLAAGEEEPDAVDGMLDAVARRVKVLLRG